MDWCHKNRERESLMHRLWLVTMPSEIFARTIFPWWGTFSCSNIWIDGWRAIVMGPVLMKLLKMPKASIVMGQPVHSTLRMSVRIYHFSNLDEFGWYAAKWESAELNPVQAGLGTSWNIHMQAPLSHHPTRPFPVEPLVPAPRPGAASRPSNAPSVALFSVALSRCPSPPRRLPKR